MKKLPLTILCSCILLATSCEQVRRTGTANDANEAGLDGSRSNDTASEIKEEIPYGKEIDLKTRTLYIAKLLKAGFKKIPDGRYLAKGKTIEEAKQTILFDKKIGIEFTPAGMPLGHRVVVLESKS